jgi:hypothetical protein
MLDHTDPPPTGALDRMHYLRSAARLLDHLAAQAVRPEDVPSVELAVGELLGKAGVLP